MIVGVSFDRNIRQDVPADDRRFQIKDFDGVLDPLLQLLTALLVVRGGAVFTGAMSFKLSRESRTC